MRQIRALVNFIDKLNFWVGTICNYTVLIVTALVVFEVMSRRVFNAPTVWTFEMITMIYGFYILITLGYGMLLKVNVSVDLLYNKFSPKSKGILDLITFIIFFFPFTILVLYAGINFAAISWAGLEKSWSVWAPPLYHFKTVIPIGIGLLLLQGISEFIKRLIYVVTGKEFVAGK